MTIDATTTLGDLVIQDPRRASVFEKLGIDYCCSGQRSLAEATADAGIDLAELVQSLSLPAPTASESTRAPGSNAVLAHDIVDTHHAYMWEEMPQLQALVDKVHQVHGAGHDELARLKELYTQAVAALDPHMTTEERLVFPAITRFEKSGNTGAFGSFVQPIDQLRAEHDAVGLLFKQIREITKDYAVPEDACGSYRNMLQRLEAMELDLHEHIHQENNVLFPRVLALEKQASAD